MKISITSRTSNRGLLEDQFILSHLELSAFVDIAESMLAKDWKITISRDMTLRETMRWSISRVVYQLFPEMRAKRLRNWCNPPSGVEYLFYFVLDAANCDAIVGDLEERYRIILRKFGKGPADFWYWKQAICSVGPIVLAWVKKLILKPFIGVIAWAVAKGLLGHDSWLATLVELYRRMRS